MSTTDPLLQPFQLKQLKKIEFFLTKNTKMVLISPKLIIIL